MPSFEEASELSSDFNGDYMEEDSLFASSCFIKDQEVPLPVLFNVICHKVAKLKDNTTLPPGCLSQEELTQVLTYKYLIKLNKIPKTTLKWWKTCFLMQKLQFVLN